MNVNFCGNRYRSLNGNWARMYNLVAEAFEHLGYETRVSQYLKWRDKPDFVSQGIDDNSDDIYVYNHTTRQIILDDNFHTGGKTLFLKPTGPTPDYFTIDSLGYAAHSSITFEKPNFENVSSGHFYNHKVKGFIAEKQGKWTDRHDLKMDSICPDIPDNHILIVGQMPGDETVTKMSFGNHWEKMTAIITELEKQNKPLVIKIHPTLRRESNKDQWTYYSNRIQWWQDNGHTVLYGFESIHDVLPKTSLAIVENSTAGIECLMYDVPMITYGYPEYHWVTFDMRHLQQLQGAVKDLSWWNRDKARSWLTWFCTQYQCHDLESTIQRLKQIL